MKKVAIKIELDESGNLVGDEHRLYMQILEVLRDVNGAATAFTITDPNKIIEVAADAEQYMDEWNVADSDRGGATAMFKPCGPSANAYKNAAISTMVVLRRRSGMAAVWKLDQVVRTEVWPRNPERFRVTLSDKGYANLLKRTSKAFGRNLEAA